MTEPLDRPVILDATVLSNYASTDSVTWLATTLEDLQTVPAVRMELEHGREAGYTYLDHAIAVLEGGDIGVVETASKQLQQDYPEIRDRLDPGEAEALVAAHTAGGTLVTDDGTARTLATEYDVALTVCRTDETYHRRSVVKSVFASLRRRFDDTIPPRTRFGDY